MSSAAAQLRIYVTTSRLLRVVVVDAVLVLACWLEGFTNQSAGWNRPFVLSVLALVALPLRRFSPEAALVLGAPSLGWAQMTLASAVLLFTLGERQRRMWLLQLAAGAVFVVTVWPQWDPGFLTANTAVVLTDAMFIAGAVGLGALRRSRAVEREQRRQLEQARSAERAAAAAAARAEERAHLAREMHDVVAHHVTLIAVQAGALQMTTGEDRSREAATSIRALASAAVDELRQVLGVLRQTRDEVAAQAGHTLGELTALVQAATSLGQVVDLQVDRRLLPEGAIDVQVVPAAVQSAVYRIVQEGLTNARKHAPGAVVQVGVARVVDGLLSEVRVDVMTRAVVPGEGTAGPTAARGQSAEGTSLGLVGLQERATRLGGSISAQMLAQGGHHLIARLPLESR